MLAPYAGFFVSRTTTPFMTNSRGTPASEDCLPLVEFRRLRLRGGRFADATFDERYVQVTAPCLDPRSPLPWGR